MEAREIRRPSLAFTVCSEATHAGSLYEQQINLFKFHDANPYQYD